MSDKVATLDQKLSSAKDVKELFSFPEVRDRFVKNYEATTTKKDGANRFDQERFAYLQLLTDKPELAAVDKFYHYAALIYCGYTGLSFRDNKLYVIPSGKGLKVQSSPAGKREMFEMMPIVDEAPEAVLVYTGDHFIHDKKNNVVKEHWSTEKTVEKNTLDNIRAAYQTIKYKDGSQKDVVVYHDDLVKAKSKSKAKADTSFWNEWPGEACKKVSTNRAYRLYHKYPDNVVVYEDVVDGEDGKTEDVHHSEVEYQEPEESFQANAGEVINEDTGEVTQAEPVKTTPAPSKKKVTIVQGDLL